MPMRPPFLQTSPLPDLGRGDKGGWVRSFLFMDSTFSYALPWYYLMALIDIVMIGPTDPFSTFITLSPFP